MDRSALKQRLQEGQALVQAKRLEDAEQYYLRLLNEHPESGGALLHLGNIYISQQRWADAIQRLRLGATIDPTNKKLRTSLARALFKNGEEAEAIALLEQEQDDGLAAKTLLMLRLEQRLQEGQALVQAGRLEDAERHYLRLLVEHPESSGALLNIGNIYISQQRWAEAIQRLRLGAAIDPTNKKLRTSLARALFKNGEEAEAIAQLEQEQDDGLAAKTLLMLRLEQSLQEGQALVQAGRLEDAERHYLRLLDEHPESSGALLHLGNIYILQERWADAIQRLRTGATIDPTNKKLRTSLARALLNNGEVTEATALLEQEQLENLDPKSLLLLQQCYATVCNWLAVQKIGARLLELLPINDPTREDALVEIEFARFNQATQAGGFDSAVEGLKDLANRQPTSASAWHAILRARLTQRIISTYQDDEVLRYVHSAVANGVADAECYHWLGKFFYKRHEWDAALQNAENALSVDPHHKAARFLLAKSLLRRNRLGEALNQLDLLLSADQSRIPPLQLKGDILVRLARLDDAIRLYRMGLRKEPGNPVINHRLSNALLLKGDIAGYHRLHEHRRNLESFIENNKVYPFPDWNGELQIDGKLLVWSESGLGVGQNILHMTFLNSLVALGLDVVFEVEPRLVELCQRSFPNINVVANHTELPRGISHQTPVASLGRWFKPDLASFGSMRPYLLPEVEAVQALREKLQGAAGDRELLVGISWSSNNPLVGDVKSVPLDQLLASLSSPGVRLVNLQYGHHSIEIQEAVATTGTQLMDSGVDTSNDLDGLAALVAALDLVVCIGHTTAHVAGAVGTPNFVLLPIGPFAHWLGQGKTCIWYPASTLFRQAPIDQDWGPVLSDVGDAVVAFRNRYRVERWLSSTLLRQLQPPSTSGGTLSLQELCDAVECFSARKANRSALALIDWIPAEQVTTELQLKRADLLALIGDWEKARAILVAHQADHGLDPALESKLLSLHLEMYDLDAALPLAVSLSREEAARSLTVANILHRKRRNEEALLELRSLSAELPDADGLSTLTGTVLLEMGEFERAQTYLAGQAAVTRLPQDYTLLGRAMSSQGRHEEALAAYDKALSISRSHPSANFWRTQERQKLGSASLVPLPPLQGDTPLASMGDVVVYFVADSTYFWQHAVLLIESIARNSHGVHCHVHVINPDLGIAHGIEVIRGLLPLLKLSYSYEYIDLDRCSADYIRTYYAAVRFVRLAEVFRCSPATFLCVDADCIIRKDLRAGGMTLPATDVAIRMRYDDRPNLSVAAGALVLRPTAAAGAFIDRVSALIRSTLEVREAVWFLDQVVLSHVVRELGGQETKIDQLDISYIDWFFREESRIWTGKGKRKSEDARYTREAANYGSILVDEALKPLGQAIKSAPS